MMENYDNAMAFAVLSLCGWGLGSWALTKWRDSKGSASIHASDRSTDDIALSALSNLGSGEATHRIDGITEMKVPFGGRIIAPAIAALLCIYVDFDPIFSSLGLQDPDYQSWAKLGLLALLIYATLMANLVQRVSYDRTGIDVWGVQLSKQSRKLHDLVGIAVHPKRPVLMMTFADQPVLYVPKFLTGRAKFVAEMQSIASKNIASGMKAPEQGLATRLGL